MTYFADTFYFLAVLNRNDPAHRRARALVENQSHSILTTQYVLLEVADAMANARTRMIVTNFIQQ